MGRTMAYTHSAYRVQKGARSILNIAVLSVHCSQLTRSGSAGYGKYFYNVIDVSFRFTEVSLYRASFLSPCLSFDQEGTNLGCHVLVSIKVDSELV